MVTAKRLRELFNYDPETGALTYRIRRGPRKAGSQAGYKHPSGHILVEIEGFATGAHRIAWCMVKGDWPWEIDHFNLIADDNRWDNLREVTHQQNCMNRPLRRDNKLGVKGVTMDKGLFRARIALGNGKLKSLGHFKTAEEASRAYEAAAKAMHGEFYSGRTT